MRISWGPTIAAGITATIAVVLFMMLIPRLVGMNPIDITQNIGSTLSAQSPYAAGAIFLGILGIIWAAVFSLIYNVLPGNNIIKGCLFGILVGLFSLMILPNILPTISNLFGAANATISSNPIALNAQTIISMIAYVIFGLIVAKNYCNQEPSTEAP